jgi:hypothetical protein
MSRRVISPLTTPKRPQNDPRENIIRKLNQDLIMERGRDKELAILENHILEIIDKTKLLTAEIVINDLS